MIICADAHETYERVPVGDIGCAQIGTRISDQPGTPEAPAQPREHDEADRRGECSGVRPNERRGRCRRLSGVQAAAQQLSACTWLTTCFESSCHRSPETAGFRLVHRTARRVIPRSGFHRRRWPAPASELGDSAERHSHAVTQTLTTTCVYWPPGWSAQDTLGFQSTNTPNGLSFQAQTWIS